MEQSANVLALASWNCFKIGDGEVDNLFMNTGKNPYHIVSIENNGTLLSDYTYEEYANNDHLNKFNDNGEDDKSSLSQSGAKWLFGKYQYCPANGSILIPLYRFKCVDSFKDESGKDVEYTNPDDIQQFLIVRMFVIPAQQLKDYEYSAKQQIIRLNDIQMDLNQKMDFGDKLVYRFDNLIKVCRNTNLAFSVYTYNDGKYSTNKVKCAFLGCYAAGQDGSSYKVSSCDAKTRYEYDS
mgnify:CR=1 FL=1